MNKVILIGRITKDIELRYTKSNIPVAITTLAVNRAKQKDKEQETDFINLIIWGKQAENCKNYVNKGNQIAVEGRIQTRSYGENGKKRYITEVVAENVQFLESKKENISSMQSTLENKEPVKDPFEEMGAKIEQETFSYNYDDLPF